MNNFVALIAAYARSQPKAPAILDVGQSILSYRELYDQLSSVAHSLAELGFRPNERIAIVMPNGPKLAVSFLGVAAVATSVPLNPSYAREAFLACFRDLDVKAVITAAHAVPAVVEAADALGLRLLEYPLFFKPEVSKNLGRIDLASADDAALVLATSGTTSRPKIVSLSHRNLVFAAQAIAQSLALSPADRCLNVMPLFHGHGLIGAVLSSLAAGASVVCTPGFETEGFLNWLDDFAPTWFTAAPAIHQAILDRAGSVPTHCRNWRLRFIRSTSAALAPKLMAELEGFFDVPVIEAYAMAEATSQVASNPLPPHVRKPGSVGVTAGLEIAVMNNDGQLLRAEETGEIAIRGPSVIRNYERSPDENKKAFIDGWFRTGDQGHVDADGYIFLTGRIKEIINRGGEKVSPREVDEVLLQHPAVAQAVVFAVQHPTLGEDLAAAIVLRAGQSASERDLRDFALSRLAGFKVPSRIVLVDAIPKGPTGKLQRIGLAEKLAGQLSTTFVAPRDEIESVIADIWQEVLGLAQSGVHDNFFAVGGDSLRAARVVARVNELFQTELTVASVFHHPTIEHYAAQVRRVAPAERIAAIAATMRDLQGLTDAEVERLLAEENE